MVLHDVKGLSAFELRRTKNSSKEGRLRHRITVPGGPAWVEGRSESSPEIKPGGGMRHRKQFTGCGRITQPTGPNKGARSQRTKKKDTKNKRAPSYGGGEGEGQQRGGQTPLRGTVLQSLKGISRQKNRENLVEN